MPSHRPPLASDAGGSTSLVRCLALDGFTPFALSGLRGWFHPARQVASDGAAQLVAASNQYFTVADHADWTIGSGFTAAGWLHRSSLGANYFAGRYANSQREWMLYTSASNQLSARLSNDGSGQQTIFVSAFVLGATGVWTFIALRYDAAQSGAELTVNFNAGKQSTSHAGGVFGSSSVMRLGASDFTLPTSTDGRLDSWGFWNRALSDAEMADLYNGGAGRTYDTLSPDRLAGLIAWYNLSEASGARRNQHQDNHHASPNGTPGPAVGIASGVAGDEDAVTSWTDQAGLLGAATQSTASARPTWEVDSYPQPVLVFDGTDDLLDLASPYSSGPGFLLAWVSAPGAAFGTILGNVGNGNMFVRQVSATQTQISNGSSTITFTHAAQSGPAVHIINGDASSAEHYLDDSEASGSTGGGLTSLAFDRIGARGGATPSYLQGDLGHVILGNAKLPSAAVNRLGRYLATRYGLPWNNVP